MIISIKKEEKNEKEILQTSKESNLHRDVIGDGAEQYPDDSLHAGISERTDNDGGIAGTLPADRKCSDL